MSDGKIDKIRVSGQTYDVKTRRNTGINKITSLSEIPVDKKEILAIISEATDFSLSEPLQPGDLAEIICMSVSDKPLVQIITGPGIKTDFENVIRLSPTSSSILKIYCYEEGKYFIVGEELEESFFDYEAGDIVALDKDTGKYIPIKPEVFNVIDYSPLRYTPIGICAVPNSHKVYGDRSAGIIGLTAMNVENPKEGGEIQNLFWGKRDNDLPYNNYGDIPYIGMNEDLGDGTCQGLNSLSQLSMELSEGGEIKNPYDKKCSWLKKTGYYAPSPYLNDGSRNPEYFRTEVPSSKKNVFSDFFGKTNSSIVIKERGDRDYQTWKPEKNAGDDYPAFSCCDIYSPGGTDTISSDWYLPSAGELGYVMARLKTINNSLVKVGKYELDLSKRIWTSSESSSIQALSFYGTSGIFSSNTKDAGAYVYPFLRITGNGRIVREEGRESI